MALEKIKPRVVDETQNYTFNDVTATGNLTALNANLGNLATANFVSGTLTTQIQPNITSVGTLQSLDVTGDASAGNIKTDHLLYANGSPWPIGGAAAVAGSNTQVQFNDNGTFGSTANFTFDKTSNTLVVDNIVASGSGLSNITAGNINGQVANATVAGTVYASSQPNITSVGTLTSVSITGNITSGNANLGNLASANYFSGSGNLLANIQGSNVTGAVAYATTANSVAGANVSGAVTYAATANAVAGANVLGAVSYATTANSVAGANVSGEVSYAAVANSVAGANVTGIVGNATHANYADVANSVAGSNVTGEVGYAAVANSVAGANVSGAVSYATTANSVAGANVSGAVSYATTANSVAGANVSGAVAYATTANSVAGANVSGQVGNALVAGTVYTAAQPNITSVGTLTGFTSNGTVNFTNASNVSLGNVANVHITGGSSGYILQTDGAGNLEWVDNLPSTTTYTANSIALTNGVFVSGNVTSIQSFGDYAAGNVYVLTDGTGSAPAWYVDIDFITVASFNRVVLNINYTQASGHTIYVQLYNNTTSAWDSIGTYTGLGSYYAFALEVIDSAPYLNSGRAQLRLYHSNSGNAGHQTSIDYAALELSSQGPQGPRGPTGATGSTGPGVATGGTTGQILTKNSGTNYDTAWSSSLALSGNIDTDGNVHVGGNLTVVGNITFSGNTAIDQITGNSGQFFGDSQGVGALYAGLTTGYATVFNPVIQASADANAYVQINFENINHGTQASTDFCATSDNGTDTKFFIDMGIAGSSWDGTQDNSLGNALQADDGYLYVQGDAGVGNLVIGTATSGTSVKFIAGGPNAGNIVGTISNTGANFKNITTPGNLTVSGNTTINGNLTINGTMTSINSTQVEIDDLTLVVANDAPNASVANGAGFIINGANASMLYNSTSNALVFSHPISAAGNLLSNIQGSNVSGAVASATTAETVTASAQGNITSVGTLTSLSVTGNANVGNIGATAGVFTGNITAGNSVSATYFVGDGSFLTGIGAVSVANGTSNIRIPVSGGNVNLTSAGNTTLVVTGTGVNVTGTINSTGNLTAPNANLGNLVQANYFQGDGGLLSNIGNVSSIYNGNSNVTVDANANVRIGVTGTANVVKISNTTVAITGNITATGNSNLGNSVTSNYFLGDGGLLSNIRLSGNSIVNNTSNVTVFSTTIGLSANGVANVALVQKDGINVAGYINGTGNLTSGNANLGNLATANYFQGNGSLLTGIVATAGASIVNGNSNVTVVANANVNISAAGNANVVAITGTGVNVAGTVTATGNVSAGANYILGNGFYLTGISTATSLVNGNSNVVVAANANVSISVTSNANVVVIGSAGANVTGTLGVSGNITGANANLGNAVRANYFVGDGSLLTGIGGAGYIFNGNSNVNIGSANANVTVSVANISNVVVISNNSLTVSGNAYAGNMYANLGTIGAQALIGTLSTGNQYNITTVGTLGNLAVTGNITANNANLGNAVRANYFVGDGSLLSNVIVGVGDTIANGNSNITVFSTAVGLSANNSANVFVVYKNSATLTGNLTVTSNVVGSNVIANGGQLVSNIATGTAPIVITSTTRVANLNVANAGYSDTAGTVVTNAQPNITSLGNLTALTVEGIANLGTLSNVKIGGGASGYFLKTDGTGNLSWAVPAGGGGSGGTSLTYTAGTTPPASGNILGDQWFNTTGNILYEYISDGSASYWVDVSTPSTSTIAPEVTGGASIIIQEEGSELTNAAASINFVGAGVTATNTGNAVTVTIPSGPNNARAFGYSMIFGG